MFNYFQLTDLMSKLNSDDFDDVYDVIKLQSEGGYEKNILFTAFKV